MIMNKSEERDGAGGGVELQFFYFYFYFYFLLRQHRLRPVDVCAASALAADGAAPNWL
jgi:hypothetical protein